MDLRQLEVFIAVAEEGSFTRAGQRLHIVQSAVSSSVSRLERQLGVPLFIRSTRNVSVSEAGAVLLASAPAVFQAMRDATDAVTDTIAGVRGTVRFGVMHAALPPGFMAAVKSFHDRYPLVELHPETRQRGSRELVEAVADGSLDFALAGNTLHPISGVQLQTVSEEDMVLISPAGHPVSTDERHASAGGVVRFHRRAARVGQSRSLRCCIREPGGGTPDNH